jgi:hypothetical protein
MLIGCSNIWMVDMSNVRSDANAAHNATTGWAIQLEFHSSLGVNSTFKITTVRVAGRQATCFIHNQLIYNKNAFVIVTTRCLDLTLCLICACIIRDYVAMLQASAYVIQLTDCCLCGSQIGLESKQLGCVSLSTFSETASTALMNNILCVRCTFSSSFV